MRLRYKVGLVLVIVALAICLMAFQSYALWVKDIVASQENVVSVGCFEIEFIEETDSKIDLKNTYPVSDEKGLKGQPYTFTITNICTIDDSYTVTLNTSTKNQITGEDGGKVKVVVGKDNNKQDIIEEYDSYNMKDKVKFALVKSSGKEIAENEMPKSGQNLGEYVKDDSHINKDTTNLTSVTDLDQSIVLTSETLKGKQEGQEKGDSVTYHLYLWFDKDKAGNEIMDKSFKASVNIIHHATFVKEEEPQGEESNLSQNSMENINMTDEEEKKSVTSSDEQSSGEDH